MKEIKIADVKIGSEQPCFVIAEAGVNHNGEVELAKQLVDAAVEAGVDAVKFQTFNADRVVSAEAPKAAYQKDTTGTEETQLEMVKQYELSPEAHRELQSYSHKKDILFISIPFDRGSVDLLDEMGVPIYKIGSGEITNWPLLEYIARKNKPIIMSTGMSYLSEVGEAVRVIRDTGNDQLALMHCVSNYPADLSDVNLRSMVTMRTAFQIPVGYSDHTTGIEVALAAVALGACAIEKHFTLDKNLPGPDHSASLNPVELGHLVKGIRLVESSLGDGLKRPKESEFENRLIVRRSLAAGINIPQGTKITSDMLLMLRPGSGISPTNLDIVVGRDVKHPIEKGNLVNWEDLR